jgi:hypothetical protein
MFGEFEDEDLLEGLKTPPENEIIGEDIDSALSTPMFNKN